MKQLNSSDNKNLYKFRNPVTIKFLRIVSILVVIALITTVAIILISENQKNSVSLKNIRKYWNNGYNYEKVYDLSKKYLEKRPMNNTALIYSGYSCFFLSQSQLENQKAQEYLDESINNLRIALYDAKKSIKPQIYYMLGKCYFYKNSISSHYYSDLALKYLLLAKENGFTADDIPEYLGLSYAAIGMTAESISAFTEALLIRESDSLLLSIAEQYFKTGENGVAKQYLYRVISDSKNDEIIIKAHNILGQIYINEEKYDAAMEEFNKVLEKNKNSADAHYGIGVIYEKQDNMVKARAQWRIVLKLQSNHVGALQKLSQN